MQNKAMEERVGLRRMTPSQWLGHEGSIRLQDIKTDKVIGETTLLGAKIMMRKCVKDHVRGDDGEILVALPDEMIDGVDQGFDVPFFYEIVKIGPDCKLIREEDMEDSQLFMYVESRFQAGIHSVTDDLIIVDEKILNGRTPPIKPFFYEEPK